MRRAGVSRLDRVSIALFAVGAVMFVVSAVFFILSVIIIEVTGEIPRFTFGELATYLGIGGMVVIPFGILAGFLAAYREKKKTGTDIDDQAKRRTAERGGPDRGYERPDLHYGTGGHGQDSSAKGIRQDYEEEARGRGLHGHRRP